MNRTLIVGWLAVFASGGCWFDCQVAVASEVPLTARDLPYSATMSVGEAVTNKAGKKTVPYEARFLSPSCKTILRGVATYVAQSESDLVDAAMLPNGDGVATNLFADRNSYGGVELVIDADSHPPRYAAIYLAHYPMEKGGCIKSRDVGVEFFDWGRYEKAGDNAEQKSRGRAGGIE